MTPYDLSWLEVVAVVGEPFNPEAWHWTYETLGHGRIYVNNTWGQTELAGCPLAGAAWLTPMKPGSCGPRVPRRRRSTSSTTQGRSVGAERVRATW